MSLESALVGDEEDMFENGKNLEVLSYEKVRFPDLCSRGLPLDCSPVGPQSQCTNAMHTNLAGVGSFNVAAGGSGQSKNILQVPPFIGIQRN